MQDCDSDMYFMSIYECWVKRNFHVMFCFILLCLLIHIYVYVCIYRAKIYGWPNTYVFTKAMGEMVVGESKGDMAVVILRPTIVTSTYKEPFPGWTEGVR